jgi:hypothetical protein
MYFRPAIQIAVPKGESVNGQGPSLIKEIFQKPSTSN